MFSLPIKAIASIRSSGWQRTTDWISFLCWPHIIVFSCLTTYNSMTQFNTASKFLLSFLHNFPTCFKSFSLILSHSVLEIIKSLFLGGTFFLLVKGRLLVRNPDYIWKNKRIMKQLGYLLTHTHKKKSSWIILLKDKCRNNFLTVIALDSFFSLHLCPYQDAVNPFSVHLHMSLCQ